MVSLVRSQVPKDTVVGLLFMIMSNLLSFVVMTVHRTRRLPIERLDTMDVFNLRPHEVSACIYIVLVEVLRYRCSLEMLVHAALEAIGEQLQHSIDVPVTERLVSRRNCRAEVASGWFQTCVRCTLACAMDAHERFKKYRSASCRVRTQVPNCRRWSKARLISALSDFWTQMRTRSMLPVSSAFLRGLNDGTVKSVTMR